MHYHYLNSIISRSHPYRDSLNVDPDRDRDSCRQFEPKNLKVDETREDDCPYVVEKGLSSQPSTTVPKPAVPTDTTVLDQSSPCPSTVSTPEIIEVGATVHKRHKHGWTGVVQAINGDLAEVL